MRRTGLKSNLSSYHRKMLLTLCCIIITDWIAIKYNNQLQEHFTGVLVFLLYYIHLSGNTFVLLITVHLVLNAGRRGKYGNCAVERAPDKNISPWCHMADSCNKSSYLVWFGPVTQRSSVNSQHVFPHFNEALQLV